MNHSSPTPLIYPVSYLLDHHKHFSDYTDLVSDINSSVSVIDRNNDLKLAIKHLLQFSKSLDTMSFYRTELNRFLNWCWLVTEKSVCDIKRQDIVEYLDFSIFPPKNWIAEQTDYAFLQNNGELFKNQKWRPFLKLSTSSPAQSSIESSFSRLSSFYTTLLADNMVDHNPVQAIRQKSKFKRLGKSIKSPKVITDEQIKYCIGVCEAISDIEPDSEENNSRQFLLAERALFALTIGLSMYLRVSEFVENEVHKPKHKDFWRDNDGHWWLRVIGKGVKERDIAVSDQALEALIRFRRVLDLSDLPLLTDNTPLLPSVGNEVWDAEKQWISKLKPLKDTLTVWKIFKWVFREARLSMIKDGKVDDAYELLCASSHWLRHTGISNDLTFRPADHVREDAGHCSTETTWAYSHATNRARATSKQSRRSS